MKPTYLDKQPQHSEKLLRDPAAEALVPGQAGALPAEGLPSLLRLRRVLWQGTHLLLWELDDVLAAAWRRLDPAASSSQQNPFDQD